MLNSGDILDEKYEVIKTLGQGGMSTVYLCKNIRLRNLWAIKEVNKELKGCMDFLAEPNILKNLNHPGIPRVVDIFYRQDNLYIVEDYIEGETLENYINRNRPIDKREMCKIVLSIGDIVSYLHSFNPPIIYRDLKPSNIMITSNSKVVLIDFGISRLYKEDGNKDTVYMGSKGYAAPEQYGTEQTCRQTDIYGLGAVMYFIVNGKAPSTLFEPLKDESYGEKIDGKLKAIIQKAMQIDIDNRYCSIDELQQEINSCFNNDTRTLLMSNKSTDYCNNTLLISSDDNDMLNKTKFAAKKECVDSYKTKIVDGANIFKAGKKDNIVEELIGLRVAYKVKERILQKIRSLNKKMAKNNKNEKNKNKLNKKGKRKIVLILLGILIVMATGYFITDHGKKYDLAVNVDKDKNQISNLDNTSKDNNQFDKSNNSLDKNTINEKQPTKDIIIEGAINKNTPIILGSNSNVKDEEKSKDKGKAKGKYKHENKSSDEEKDVRIMDIAYQVNPVALCGKYNNKFIIKIQEIEFKGNDAILYCYLENNTGEKLSIKYDGTTYLLNDKNEYIKASISSSTDLSSISSGAKIGNAKLTFTNFNADTRKIILKTKINIDSSQNDSKEVNVNINVN